MPTKLTFQNCSIRGCTIAAAIILSSSLVSAQMVTHVAGSFLGGGASDGLGAAASFETLSGIALDHDGNLIVPDPFNSTIRRVTPTGFVTTIAGLAGSAGYADGAGASARFNQPIGAAVDSHGNIFVADQTNFVIRKITPSGVVTTFAGSLLNPGSLDGQGTAARFSFFEGIAIDRNDNLWLADSADDVIRKITPAGAVTTVAGVVGHAGSTDGNVASALFNDPFGLVVDGAGNVYVSDTDNNTIRKITPDGTVSTLAGSPGVFGSTDGTGSGASFAEPKQLALDGSGNLYVADDGENLVRKVTPAGVVTTIAGLLDFVARPRGIAINGNGTVYLGADTSLLQMDESGGNLVTLAGSEPRQGFVDATGSDARFVFPVDVTVDHNGNLYVSDEDSAEIRKVDPAGAVSPFVGSGIPGSNDGTGTGAGVASPFGVVIDGNGNLYFTDFDTIRKATSTGVVTTLAGQSGASGSLDATGSNARFSTPAGIAVDATGNLYVVDVGNDTIRKIDTGGVVTTLAGTAGLSGSADGHGGAARFQALAHLTFGPDGNLYVVDNNAIRVVTLSGDVTTLHLTTSDGRTAGFSQASGIVFDPAGNFWLSDEGFSQIARVNSDHVVTYPVGIRGTPGAADGPGGSATFSQGGPTGITADRDGVLYLVDTLNYCIRAIGADLGDRATIDSSGARVGVTRQLDVAPQHATTWSWSIYRQPAGSTASLSSTTIRNPTFTPDVTGRYIFRLLATNGGLKSVSTVSLTVEAVRARSLQVP